jgi:hypothetical protein
MATGARIREYDKRTHKKCIKCRRWKPREDLTVDYEDKSSKVFKRGFGRNVDSADGLQSICMECKNPMNTAARVKNVAQRVRHHTATRCLTQLGDLAPEGFVADLEKHLGYKIARLIKRLGADLKEREGPNRKLRDALQEGYHIDHIKPLSSFEVIIKPAGMGEIVDWDAFRACWALDNLRAIPAADNLAKGAKHDATQAEGQEDASKGAGKTKPAPKIEIIADA